MANRDDFTQKVKQTIALRASYRCSFKDCNRPTVGPSEESGHAVNIGKAAHIRAAAHGGPRYDPSMLPEERSGIGNAIWLCATHADMIDRDLSAYTVEVLESMKTHHEAQCATELRMQIPGSAPTADLVAVGPDVVFLGDFAGVREAEWQFLIRHYVIGDLSSLVAFIDSFKSGHYSDRYILANCFGDGRALAGTPSLTNGEKGTLIQCPVYPPFERTKATELPADIANDLNFRNGDIQMVRGIEALPQKIQNVLSIHRGEMPWSRGFGTRLAEYYSLLRGSPWFDDLFKLEVIRQAAIPHFDPLRKIQYTPLLCVERVHRVEILTEVSPNNWLPVRFELDVKGLGRWEQELSIYMPEPPSHL